MGRRIVRLLATLLVSLLAGCFIPCGHGHTSDSGTWTEPGLYGHVAGEGLPRDHEGSLFSFAGPEVPGGFATLSATYLAPVDGGGLAAVLVGHGRVLVYGAEGMPLATAEPLFLESWRQAMGEGERGPAVFQDVLANASTVGAPMGSAWLGAAPDWHGLLALTGEGWETVGLGALERVHGPWTIQASLPVQRLSGTADGASWDLAVDVLDQARFSLIIGGPGTVDASEARAALAAAFASLGLAPPPASRLPDGVLLAETNSYCS